MKLGGNRPPGDNPLLFSISGTGSFICPVAQTWLDIPRPLITQSPDTAGHTKAFDSILYSGYCRLTESVLINNQIEVSHQLTQHNYIRQENKEKKNKNKWKKEYKIEDTCYIQVVCTG